MSKRKITAVLTGSESLNRKLEALTSAQSKAAIRKAARPALMPTLAAAKANAPKLSGRLQRSIKIRAIKRSRSRVGARVTTAKSDNQFSGRTFYAALQEWGWKTGRRRSQVAAREAAMFSSGIDSATIRGKRKRDRRRTANSLGERRLRPTGARRQIPAKEYLRRAARSTRRQALRLYSDGIRVYIRSIARK